MLMQVTVDNNDTLITVRLLFLVDEVSEGRFQTTAPHTARGFDTPVHHSPLGGCLLLIHIHPYRHIIIVRCFHRLSSILLEVAIFALGYIFRSSTVDNSIHLH